MEERPRQAAKPSIGTSIGQRLERLRSFDRRTAYYWREGVRWRRRTYSELHDRVHSCAGRLREAGAGPGVPVMIQGPAGPDWVEALLGTFFLGGVAVPLDEATPEAFRAEVARRSEARLLVAPRGIPAPEGTARIILGEWPASPSRRSALDRGAGWSSEATAELVFTSGTTGEPKGVVLTHGNLSSDFHPIERGFLKRESLVRPFGELRMISTLPLSHMFGQALSVFLPLFMGLTVAFVPARPREVQEAARRLGAWGLFTVPRLMDLLSAEVSRILREEGKLESFDARRRRFAAWPFYLQPFFFLRLQRLFGWRFRLFVVGGAALPAEVQRFWEESGYLVVQGYGLTETAPIVSISNPFERRAGSVGKPLGIQEVKLSPDGEVLVRGPNVTRGYFGTETPAGEGGWFHTGDIGELDEKGRLRIRGRLKDVIVTAEGENVYPGDVEAALARVKGVREACVLGIPGPGGEKVHAVLILDERADAGVCVESANAGLQPKQRIKDYTIWREGEFPRTATGKIRKGVLRERILASRSEQAPSAGESSSTLESVRRVIARVARVDPSRITPQTRLVEGLGFASLDLVELAVAFEEEFGVSLPEDRLNEATVGELERAAKESMHEAKPAPSATETAAPARDPAAPIVPGGCTTSPWPGGAARQEDETREDQAGSKSGPPASQEAPEDERPIATKTDAGARGFLRMPRWTRLLPVRLARRLIEELLLRPFVLIYSRPKVVGRKHLRSDGAPYLFVSNHHSYWDTGLLKTVLPWSIRARLAPAMTTRYHRVYFGQARGNRLQYWKERFQVGLVEFFFNAWPLPETAGFRSSLTYAGELADEGCSLLIFPEGRHVPEEELERFRGGIGIFARDLRMPVVPVYVEGTGKVLPDGTYWPRFGKARAVLGVPIRIEPDADPLEVTRRLEEAVRLLRRATRGG